MLLYAAGPYIQIQIRLFCGVNMTHMTHMSCLFYAANECCEPQEMKQLHGPQICKFAGDS